MTTNRNELYLQRAPLPDDFKMAVGDVNSKEMGSAARANGDKPDWFLMPLGQVSHLMRNLGKLEALKYEIGDPEMTQTLADFQAGDCSVEVLLEAAVAYNWAIYCFHVKKEATIMESLEAVIAVWEYGLIKYSEFNWATGAPWSVPIACMQRHINWYWDKGEIDDQESNQLHSAHVVCNAMMLVHYATYWEDGDDRPLFAFPKDEPKIDHPAAEAYIRSIANGVD